MKREECCLPGHFSLINYMLGTKSLLTFWYERTASYKFISLCILNWNYTHFKKMRPKNFDFCIWIWSRKVWQNRNFQPQVSVLFWYYNPENFYCLALFLVHIVEKPKGCGEIYDLEGKKERNTWNWKCKVFISPMCNQNWIQRKKQRVCLQHYIFLSQNFLLVPTVLEFPSFTIHNY